MIAAVVLAGGRSRRFGADKLRHEVGGRRLLDLAVAELPVGTEVVLVGPETPGGPAAALVAGLRRALPRHPDAIVVLPGDAPQAGRAAVELLGRLTAAGVDAVVAVDPDGREQPLQLALRPAAAEVLLSAAGPAGAVDGSARALVAVLGATPHPLSAAAVFDIDTREQLRIWELRQSPAVERVLARLPRPGSEPFVVALDGPSGVGKSTLAGALALRTRSVVVAGDLFYNPDLGRDPRPPQWTAPDIAGRVIDWRRLRAEAVEPLRAGRAARFAPYDWAAQDGSLGRERTLNPAPVIVLDGVYSSRPELADLVDLAVYVDIDPTVRQTRLEAREADPQEWRDFWALGEQHYFTRVRPRSSFDLHP